MTRPQLEFTAERAGYASAPSGATTPPTVRAGPGLLEVLGLMGTPNPCYHFRAAVTCDGTRLDLTVTAHPDDVPCIQIVALFAYSAVVSLSPGRYQLTVAHAFQRPDRVASETVLELGISVP